MIGDHQCLADLGPVRVAVATDHAGLLDYLRDFYPLDGHTGRQDSEGAAEWAFDARLTTPAPEMALTPWQVGYHADPDARRAVIRSTNPATSRSPPAKPSARFCRTTARHAGTRCCTPPPWPTTNG